MNFLPGVPRGEQPKPTADTVPVVEEKSGSARITLEDGAVLSIRVVVVAIGRHRFEKDADGNPAYQVQAQLQTTLVRPPRKEHKLIS